MRNGRARSILQVPYKHASTPLSSSEQSIVTGFDCQLNDLETVANRADCGAVEELADASIAKAAANWA